MLPARRSASRPCRPARPGHRPAYPTCRRRRRTCYPASRSFATALRLTLSVLLFVSIWQQSRKTAVSSGHRITNAGRGRGMLPSGRAKGIAVLHEFDRFPSVSPPHSRRSRAGFHHLGLSVWRHLTFKMHCPLGAEQSMSAAHTE
eukprot:3526215-Rhodomonas_salina.2